MNKALETEENVNEEDLKKRFEATLLDILYRNHDTLKKNMLTAFVDINGKKIANEIIDFNLEGNEPKEVSTQRLIYMILDKDIPEVIKLSKYVKVAYVMFLCFVIVLFYSILF